MALTFTTTKMVAPAQESCDLSKLDLLNATESLNQAWMDLTDAQRGIDGLQEIMDNVTQSVELLTKFGADAIPMLNQDGGLESLLQIPERLITVEKAQEGLGEAAKAAWEKFKEFVTRIWNAVKNWFKNIFASDERAANDAKQNAEALSKLTPEEKESFLNSVPNKSASTESLDLGELKTNIIVPYADMEQLILGVETGLDLMRNIKDILPSDGNLEDMLKHDPEAFINSVTENAIAAGREATKIKSSIIKATFDEDTLVVRTEVIYAPAAEEKSLTELGWTIDNAIKFNQWYSQFSRNKANIEKLVAKAGDTTNAWVIMVADKLSKSDNENVRKFSGKLINLLKIQLTQNLERIQITEKFNACLKTHVKYFKGELHIHD